jgi:hypothetical protein
VTVGSFGYQVAEWIEANCVIPDGWRAGEPYRLTEEMHLFLERFYAVDEGTGQFVYRRGGQLIRPQKWGKGPFSAAIICAEALAPVVPVLEYGRFRVRRWPKPWIQVTAVSEDQTVNVFSALIPMIALGPLASQIPDSGLGRINLPSGGWIEPVTASGRSRLGQRVTFTVQDETHSWLQSNGGWTLADNQRRNLAGMGGRFLETTNAFDPVEMSVAQRTFEAKAPGTLIDDAPAPPGSVRDRAERDVVLSAVYKDALVDRGGWVDRERIHAEIDALLEHDAAQAERFFLNRKLATEGAAFDLERFKALKRSGYPPRGSIVTVGVDGARHDDALAMVATDVKTGFQWPLAIIERPDGAGEDYEHDLALADGAMVEAMERYVVWRVYIDPQYIDTLVEKWSNRYGPKRIIEWLTYRPRQIAWAVREYAQAIGAGDVKHDGDETFVRHVANARKRVLTVKDDKERPMHTLAKDSARSPRKIDAAMAGVLSWQAATDARELGVVRLDPPTAAPVEEAARERVWRPGDPVPAVSEWPGQRRDEALPLGFMM